MRAKAALAALAMLAGAGAGAASPPAPLRFERVFATRGGAIGGLHASIAYRAGGAAHRMELWRDGDARVARETDGLVRSYAAREAGGDSFTLTMLDARRRIRTDIDRDSLYRVGSLADWFDIAHGLRHPRGAYRLTASPPPRPGLKPAAPCRWYALAQDGRRSTICWSADLALPMMIAGDDGALVWQVLAVERGPVAPARFAIRDKGFVRVNATRDISGD